MEVIAALRLNQDEVINYQLVVTLLNVCIGHHGRFSVLFSSFLVFVGSGNPVVGVKLGAMETVDCLGVAMALLT